MRIENPVGTAVEKRSRMLKCLERHRIVARGETDGGQDGLDSVSYVPLDIDGESGAFINSPVSDETECGYPCAALGCFWLVLQPRDRQNSAHLGTRHYLYSHLCEPVI